MKDKYHDGTVNPKEQHHTRKPRIGLVPPPALLMVAEAMRLGADKYGPYNWRSTRVLRSVYLEAALRHILLAMDGEDVDPESGVPHEAHAAACLCIVLDALLTGSTLIDDRHKTGVVALLMERFTRTTSLNHTREDQPDADEKEVDDTSKQ